MARMLTSVFMRERQTHLDVSLGFVGNFHDKFRLRVHHMVENSLVYAE